MANSTQTGETVFEQAKQGKFSANPVSKVSTIIDPATAE
jgi:hypothetical protein